MKRYCLNCGKKFYPNSWTAQPQDHFSYHSATGTTRLEIPAEHKHFHSLGCMKEWIAKNHEAFHLLLTNVGNSDTTNETNNHN